MLEKLEIKAALLARVLTFAGFAALLVLAAATVADIIGRTMFRTPLHGVGDLAAVIMAVIVFASFPACFMERRNINVDLLGQGLGKRAGLWLELLGQIASLAFTVVLAWQLCRYAADIQQSGQTTWVLRLPLAPWWWAAAGMAVLTVPAQLIVTLRALSDALLGPPPKPDAGGDTHV